MTPLPDWLTALLAERYPRSPAGLQLLTLRLRPRATAHLMVQSISPEDLLTGFKLLLVSEEHPLPKPLFEVAQ